MKKCPVCNSTRVTQNLKGDKHCKRCGYINERTRNKNTTNNSTLTR